MQRQKNRKVGETCRNLYIRGQEHQRELNKKLDKSVLYKHVREDHINEENKVKFDMKITGRFKKPLSRQLDEAIRIHRKPPK